MTSLDALRRAAVAQIERNSKQNLEEYASRAEPRIAALEGRPRAVEDAPAWRLLPRPLPRDSARWVYLLPPFGFGGSNPEKTEFAQHADGGGFPGVISRHAAADPATGTYSLGVAAGRLWSYEYGGGRPAFIFEWTQVSAFIGDVTGMLKPEPASARGLVRVRVELPPVQPYSIYFEPSSEGLGVVGVLGTAYLSVAAVTPNGPETRTVKHRFLDAAVGPYGPANYRFDQPGELFLSVDLAAGQSNMVVMLNLELVALRVLVDGQPPRDGFASVNLIDPGLGFETVGWIGGLGPARLLSIGAAVVPV